jgi:hypothetical protein
MDLREPYLPKPTKSRSGERGHRFDPARCPADGTSLHCSVRGEEARAAARLILMPAGACCTHMLCRDRWFERGTRRCPWKQVSLLSGTHPPRQSGGLREECPAGERLSRGREGRARAGRARSRPPRMGSYGRSRATPRKALARRTLIERDAASAGLPVPESKTICGRGASMRRRPQSASCVPESTPREATWPPPPRLASFE